MANGPAFTQSPYRGPQTAEALNPSAFSGIITVLQQIAQNQLLILNAINDKFPNWVAVPAMATSPGTPGEVAYDNSHFYLCVQTNVWVRAALSTF